VHSLVFRKVAARHFNVFQPNLSTSISSSSGSSSRAAAALKKMLVMPYQMVEKV